MTHDDYRKIRSSYAPSRDLDRRLVEELRRVAARLVRYRGLPPSYAPYGVWNEEAEDEVFQSWMTERLIAGGQLQALLDRATNVESFRRLAERSLRQHVVNQRDRSQAQNIYWRTADMLEEDDDFHAFVAAARPQNVWWGLASWRDEARAQFGGGDAELIAHAWALGDFAIIRYRPDARKLSPVLAAADLKRLLVGLFERVQALLTLSGIMRAVEHRFDLGEVRLEPLAAPEAEAAPADESDALVLEETAVAIIAEMSSRQVEVLLGTEADETIDAMAERLGYSVGTIVNEQRRVATLLDRHSGSDQRATLLRKVLDLLYEEGERR